MLKIRTSQDEGFALVAISGRIEATCLSELQRCLDRTAKGAEVAIDLDEVTLVDGEVRQVSRRLRGSRDPTEELSVLRA